MRRAGACLVAAASVAAFAAAVFLRMDAAYGPFNLSADPADWTIVWELWSHGQIGSGVVAQGALLGVAAAAVPWLAFALLSRRRSAR